MKAKALALSLILILVPLAGCSGTDTEVTVDMDSEDLQAIIDDNRDDFLNNTTVVVFQEYHNNTTVINHNSYSNNTTTNVDESGASSSTTTYNYNGSSNADLRMFTVEWSIADKLGDPLDIPLTRPICRSDSFYYSGNCSNELYYGEGDDWDNDGVPDEGLDIGAYNDTILTILEYNDQVVAMSATCYESYEYYRMDHDDWQDYLANNYGYDSNEISNAASTLNYRMDDLWSAYDVERACGNWGTYSDWYVLFEIDLEPGTTLEFLSIPGELVVDVNCDDGFGTGLGNGSESHLVGGQANCTISGSAQVYWENDEHSGYYYDENGEQYCCEYYLELDLEEYYSPPESFAVYFELHPVTVHQ